MATLQQQIADKFLAKLAESKDVESSSSTPVRSSIVDCGVRPRNMVSFASSAWRSMMGGLLPMIFPPRDTPPAGAGRRR